MKWLGFICPVILSVAAYFWFPLGVWIDLNQGLLAFLGLLVAAIVQIIPVTANFIQADRLTPAEAINLSGQLAKQQRYWIGLLASTILTVVIIVIVSVLKDKQSVLNYRFDLHYFGIVFSNICSAVVAFMVSFTLFKMVGIFGGVISLQKLRSELVINAAKRNAAEQAVEIQAKFSQPENIVPTDYGSVIHH